MMTPCFTVEIELDGGEKRPGSSLQTALSNLSAEDEKPQQ